MDGLRWSGGATLTFLPGGVQLCDLHRQQVDQLLQTVHPQGEAVGLGEQLAKDVLGMPTCRSQLKLPAKGRGTGLLVSGPQAGL